jgi:hypothetical protein
MLICNDTDIDACVVPLHARFGGAEQTCASAAAKEAVEADSSDDEGAAAAEAAMLTEEEALIVTNRLHQVISAVDVLPNHLPACCPWPTSIVLALG